VIPGGEVRLELSSGPGVEHPRVHAGGALAGGEVEQCARSGIRRGDHEAAFGVVFDRREPRAELVREFRGRGRPQRVGVLGEHEFVPRSLV
jgi:hypothetical protein